MWDRSVLLKRASDGSTTATWNMQRAGEEYWLRGANMKIWFSLMNRSVIVPDHHQRPSSKGPSNLPFKKKTKKKNSAGKFICWKVHLIAVFSCPSVYLSFIPEAWTAGKWINKDWAKIGSRCVCSWGMLAASALTASLSRRTEWRDGAAELAGC